MENKFYDTKLIDIYGKKINIGSTIRLKYWYCYKVIYENGKFYIKGKYNTFELTEYFIKKNNVEVIS